MTVGASGPRVVLGMTLHNNAAHLPEAIESLLSQSLPGFALVMLDDGSQDETAAVAARYQQRDSRVRYYHQSRQGMIGAWRGVAEIAVRDYPAAEYFAWVSDHDRWHPEWLATLVARLDTSPDAVLAYPMTRRLTPDGREIDKLPRQFDTGGRREVRDRWRHFCRSGAGAGDMVYGLIRTPALRAAGIFRPVLRPDRLLVAELVLRGGIVQVPEILWYRRNSVVTSVARQRHTLMAPGTEPPWFWWPPWTQHARMLRREYSPSALAELGVSAAEWRRMRLLYQATYGWRHARKSETSLVLGRGLDRLILARKMLKHHYHHAVYRALTALHSFRARDRGRPRTDDAPSKSEQT